MTESKPITGLGKLWLADYFTASRKKLPMNEHAEALQTRLTELFESKAEEFSRYSEDNPKTALVTSQLAGLYKDLVQVMKN